MPAASHPRPTHEPFAAIWERAEWLCELSRELCVCSREACAYAAATRLHCRQLAKERDDTRLR
jgi:hypothetical protein